MNLLGYMQQIGTKQMLRLEGLTIPVTIKDVKAAFGRIDVLVKPVNGDGEKWVDSVKIVLGDE